MATLTAPAPSPAHSLFESEGEIPPRGTHIGTCIATKDAYGVERRKFQSDQTEKVDLTAFQFGIRDRAGRPFKIATRSLRLSGHPKSGLFQFLTSWLGEPPAYNLDLATLKGRKALLTIAHEPSRTRPGVVYARIVGIAPVPEGFEAPAPAAAVPPPLPPPAAPATPAAEQDDFPF